MSIIAPVEHDDLVAYFDDEIGISLITYGGTITADTIGRVYRWVEALLQQIDPASTRGVIYDFRDVREFHPTYLAAVQRQSKRMERDHDNSGHAVALIVDTLYQETMVKMSAQLGAKSSRPRVHLVNSMEAALTFIDDWHSARV